MRTIVSVSIAALLATACGSSLKDIEAEHAKGGGVTRLYAAPEPKMREVVTSILKEEGGAPAVTESGAIEAELPATLGQQSVIVAAWTHPDDATHTNVSVITHRSTFGGVAVRFTDDGFQEAIAKRLAKVSAPTASNP